MIKLIGIDLDGTLLTQNKTISPRNMAAIKAALARGVHVMPATGRQLVGVPEEFLAIPGMSYALTANGAAIWRLQPREIIHRDCFTDRQAWEIYHRLQGFDALVTIFCGNRGYCEAGHLERIKASAPPEIYSYLKRSRKDVESLAEVINAQPDQVEKFSVFFTDMDERERVRELFTAMGGISVTSSMADNLELNTATANKGLGLLHVAGLLGLGMEQVMAIGDSYNDLSMIQMAGLSVAMANGEEIVKASATAITDSCENDGVAKAIEKYVL